MSIKFPKISIYDKYILKQVAGATIGAVLLFTIVWIAPEILLNTVRDALDGKYDFNTALVLLLCELPKILDKAIPVGLLLGTLFTFDKLSKDSEMTIFRAIGMSFQRIVAPVVVFALLFASICFVLENRGTPYAESRLRAIRGDVIHAQYIYTQKDKSGHPLLAIVISRAIGRNMENVTVLDFSNKIYQDVHQLTNIYVAQKGYADDDAWHLQDVSTYQISNDGIYVKIAHKDKLDILDKESAQNAFILMNYSALKERDISNPRLRKYLKLLKHEKLDEEYNYMLNKYLQRFLSPLVGVLLAILGCLLGFSKPREQRVVGFTIGIGCVFVYYITLPFFDLLAEKGILSPYLTAIIPAAAFMFAIYIFYKLKDL